MHKVLTGSLRIERCSVAIAGLPTHLQGLRLVQLSDFHFDGIRLSETLLQEAIAASNAANPDLVMLTGDFVTDDPMPIHALAEHLAQLKSRLGSYAVLGNHDIRYRQSRGEITRALTHQGIHVLWNEIAYPMGAEFPVVGFADSYSHEFRPAEVMNQLDAALPRLVLSHNPDTAERLAQWRVDLQLSGHSHGGQVYVPGLGNMSHQCARIYRKLPKKAKRLAPLLKEFSTTMKHWEWAQGLHQIGYNQLYVNRGLGTYLPGRLCCPPEVSVITLTGR